MKDFVKRLSFGALKTALRHYRDDTYGKLRKGIADTYETFVDKFAVVFRRLWLAVVLSSFVSAGMTIVVFGIIIVCFPLIFTEGMVKPFACAVFGVATVLVGLASIFLPLGSILALTRKETVREIFEVDEVRKKLVKD